MDLVFEKAGKPVTTSIKVAEIFEKRHDHIIRDINVLTNTAKSLDISLPSFEESKYVNDRGREYPMFIMDRDAFSLLVFGFNGPKALKFKVGFIKAFNNMQFELEKAQAKLIDANNLPAILRITADALENASTKEILLSKTIKKPINKITLTKISRNMETTSVTYMLKKMGFRSKKTTEFMKTEGYLKNERWYDGSFRKIPTEKGKPFFKAEHTGGLYIKQDGIVLLNQLKIKGIIPEDCLITA